MTSKLYTAADAIYNIGCIFIELDTIMKNILKPAKSFRVNTVKKDLLMQVVNSFLYQLSSDIENTSKDNKSRICVRLPSGFNLPNGINEENFKKEEYYYIIMAIEEKGYSATIKKNETDFILVVSWLVEDSKLSNEIIEKLKSVTRG